MKTHSGFMGGCGLSHTHRIIMQPKEKRKKIRAIRINDKWCKQCGICVEFCPREVLIIETAQIPMAIDLDNCTACRMCELRCPDYAISVEEVNG